MKPEFESIALIKKTENHRFEITFESHKAFIDYTEWPHHIALIHTEVEPELEGKGAATALIEKTLHYLEVNHYKLTPICPLAFAYIKKHPEWKRIVHENFKGFDR